jgi:large subunit ribosomal protein L15
MKLNELAPNPGARKARKRVGRGIGSGTGKTDGRGHKGQRARSGVATRTFDGCQMPIYRRLPKRGFKNPFRYVYSPVNLYRIQAAIDAGRLDPKETIDLVALRQAGLVGRRRDGIRLLARGELKTAVTIEVDSASKTAAEAVEKAGGKLVIGSSEEKDTAAPAAKPARAAARPAAEKKADDAETGEAQTDEAPAELEGTRPEGLAAPEGEPDDLKKIGGVGPKLETTLNELGIYHYRQIAEFTPDNVTWVDGYLSFKGRIDRDDWIGQAKALAEGAGTTESETASDDDA